MKVRVCPQCGKQNSESTTNCIECGTTLSLKTLVDTESRQFASNADLSNISSSFEQDVAKTLKTVKSGFEDIIWGCNISQISKKSPFLFGYLIVTSQRMICVYFEAETNTRGLSKRAYLDLTSVIQKFSLEVLFGLFMGLIMGRSLRTIIINDLNSPLTAKEKASRKAIDFDRKQIVSTSLISTWQNEIVVKSLVARFKKGDEVTLTFTIPDNADKLRGLLKTSNG